MRVVCLIMLCMSMVLAKDIRNRKEGKIHAAKGMKAAVVDEKIKQNIKLKPIDTIPSFNRAEIYDKGFSVVSDPYVKSFEHFGTLSKYSNQINIINNDEIDNQEYITESLTSLLDRTNQPFVML